MDQPLSIKEFGSFYIGGRNFSLTGLPVYESSFVKGGPVRRVDPNGDFETGQMYVQYYQLERPRTSVPVLLWHGGGVTGASWENTPDGREGWLHFFLRAGFNTYVSDAVERGRASWSRYPEIYQSEPVFRSKEEAWVNFRIGPAYSSDQSVVFPNGQFPSDRFDVFMKQSVPRWTSNNAAILAAYEEYIQAMGPSILVVHSQASEFAGKLVQQYPQLIKALVLLEASSVPEKRADLADVPMLYIWGDNIRRGSLWDTYRHNVHQFFTWQREQGKSVEWIDLPAQGIEGNSHFLMMDKNNKAIFDIARAWIERYL
ncbi:MAG: hypothetical protein E6X17_14395 [Sporomusaceae bacterium]|nr:hypothetical protein [Sporomusaceae bacterium]